MSLRLREEKSARVDTNEMVVCDRFKLWLEQGTENLLKSVFWLYNYVYNGQKMVFKIC